MFGLDTDTIRNIKNCFAKIPQIQKVLLYGSRAKGNYKNGSDIDLILIGKNLNPDDSIYPLKEELNKLYLPYTFDISILSKLDKLEFINRILKVGKTFYQKETNELPAGWQQKKLGDVCEKLFAGGDVPKNNFSKTKTDKFNIPIFSNGIKDNGLYGFTNIKKVNKPSITISARGTIGYSVLRKETFYPVIRLIVVSPKEKLLDLFFLKYVLNNISFLNSGTAIPQLTVPMIKEYQITFPPLAEQKRIVAVLDKTFTTIDKIKNNTEKNLANTKELWQSYLQQSFNNPKKNWQQKKLKDCIEKVFYTKKIQKKDFLKKGKFPIISQEENYINGYWDNEIDVFRIKNQPIVIFGDHTRVIKYIDFDFVLGADGVKIIKPIYKINPKFFYYFIFFKKSFF